MARVLGVTPDGHAPEGQAPGGDAGGLSLVKLGVARVEWIGVRQSAVAGIGRLRGAIDAEFKDDPLAGRSSLPVR